MSSTFSQPNRKVQRNEPCPCGSGKKYKHCCLSQAQAPDPDAAKHQLYEAYGLLFTRVTDYVHEDLPVETTALAWADFHQGDPPEIDPDSPDFIEFFVPWMLFYWRAEVPDPTSAPETGLTSDPAQDDSPPQKVRQLPAVAEMFQARIDTDAQQGGRYARHKLTAVERSLIHALGQSPYSFFQVNEIIDQKYVTVTDLIVQRQETVFMPEFGEGLWVGCIIYGQILTVDGMTILPAVAPILFYDHMATALGNMERKVKALMPELGEDWRREMDDDIRSLYFGLCTTIDEAEGPDDEDDASAQSLGFDPGLFEDPDKPMLTTLTYTLTGTLQDHVRALAHLSPNTAEDLLCGVESESDEHGVERDVVRFAWRDEDLDVDGAHLGDVTISDDRLTAHLVGEDFNDQFKHEVERHMGRTVEGLEQKVVTVSDMVGQVIKQRITDRRNRRQ